MRVCLVRCENRLRLNAAWCFQYRLHFRLSFPCELALAYVRMLSRVYSYTGWSVVSPACWIRRWDQWLWSSDGTLVVTVWNANVYLSATGSRHFPWTYSPRHVPQTFPRPDNFPPFSHGVGHSSYTTTTMRLSIYLSIYIIKRSTVNVYKLIAVMVRKLG